MMYKVRKTNIMVTPPKVVENLKTQIVFREGEPTDRFYFQTEIGNECGNKCTVITNPLYMLLSQTKLKNLMTIGADNAQAWFQRMLENTSVVSEFTELSKKCSNEELLSMVRSRHIQSLSELNTWCKQMHNDHNQFVSVLEKTRKELEEQQKSNEAQTQDAVT